eukprot:TRINITY_DN15993_c0_g1_i1.p1 TRINITY_DN15993_c0_g1~~TRINITY_DN15993_c0_g1_i1.p1  ORF type:complete len:394 (+),score=2.96 TRINITY_DN15993_c0_g1_i1:365-1546(+)
MRLSSKSNTLVWSENCEWMELYLAVERDDLFAVSSILRRSNIDEAFINYIEPNIGYSCLHAATAMGSLRLVTALLSHPYTNINLKTSQNGQTALMLAVSAGRENLVNELLSFGADASIRDDHGRCAADYCLFTQKSISDLLHQASSWRPRGILHLVFSALWFAFIMALVHLPYTSYDQAIVTAVQHTVEVAPILWILSRHFQWGTTKQKPHLWILLGVFFVFQAFSSEGRFSWSSIFGLAALKSVVLVILQRCFLSTQRGPFPNITCRFSLRDQLIRYHYQFPPMIFLMKAVALILLAAPTEVWTAETNLTPSLFRACSTMISVYILRVFIISSFTTTPFGPTAMLTVFLTTLSHFLGSLVPFLTHNAPFATVYDDLVRHILWAALASLATGS